MRKRTSKIWSIPVEELRHAVAQSRSLYQVLQHFELDTKGYCYRNIKKRLSEEGIDYSKMPMGINSNKCRPMRPPPHKIPLKQILVKGSTYCTGLLKSRLLRIGLLKNVCSICNLLSKWNGDPLVLVIDHIDGDCSNHTLSNLRMLCPNCNSQQPTFAGRNNKKIYEKRLISCNKCGTPITTSSKSGLCHSCFSLRFRKVKNQPPRVRLLGDLEKMSYRAVGRKYGVSDNAIRKWVKGAKMKGDN